MRSIDATICAFIIWWPINYGLIYVMEHVSSVYSFLLSVGQGVGNLVIDLVSAILATTISSCCVRRIAKYPHRGEIGLLSVMLFYFIPIHAVLINQYPLWYHVLFFGSIVTIIFISRLIQPGIMSRMSEITSPVS